MKLLKNFMYNGFYQLLLVILPVITAPYISRIFGTHGIGLNAYSQSITQYFVIAATLGTYTYGNREIAYNQSDKRKRSQIFWGITFVSWMSATISILAFVGYTKLFNPNHFNLYMIQGIAILVSLFDISWYFVGRENFKLIVLRNLIIKTLTVACIFIFIHHSDDLLLYIFILTFGGFLGSLSLWPYLRKEVYLPKFKDLRIKKHLYNSLLIFIPSLAAQIMLIANKNMIGGLDSLSNAGIYTQSDTIIRMVLSVVSSIWVVLLPRMASMHSKGDTSGVRSLLVKTIDISLGISTGMAFGISAVALKFAPLFFGNSFREVGIIMIMESPMIVLFTLSQVLGDQYLLPLNKMAPFILSATTGTLINIILNSIFIPIFGIVGAVVSINIAQLFMVIYRYSAIKKEFYFGESLKSFWKYFISGLLMFVVVFWMNQSFKMTMIQLILQIVVGILIYILSNILLKTQLWLMASDLLGKMQNRVSGNHIRIDQDQEILEHPLDTIEASIDQFDILFQEVDEKERLSHANFLTTLNNFENTLKNVTFNDELNKNDIIRLSDFIAELSIMMSKKREYLKVQDQEQLHQFAQGLNILVSKMEKIAQEEHSPKELKEWFKNELGE